MNRNLNDAIAAIERADALMFAIENCYLDFDILPEEMERANRGAHTFYALWDAIKAVRADLDKLDGDRRVVDVINAVTGARRLERTLTKED